MAGMPEFSSLSSHSIGKKDLITRGHKLIILRFDFHSSWNEREKSHLSTDVDKLVRNWSGFAAGGSVRKSGRGGRFASGRGYILCMSRGNGPRTVYVRN